MLPKQKLGNFHFKPLFSLTLLLLVCSGCFHPPFNDFKPSSFLSKPSKKGLIQDLQKQDIQYVEYGDTMTLIIPTDHYFVKGSAEINDICYAGLNNVVKLLHLYPQSRIFVASFSDDVRTARYQKHISQARAEAMLTFLWANAIPAKQLTAKGYGDLFPIGDNRLIHGSAFNRRIEIQWFKIVEKPQEAAADDNHNMK